MGARLSSKRPKPRIGVVRPSARNEAHFYVGLRFEETDTLLQKKIAQMREWFTSAEFRAKSAARKEASSSMNLKAPKLP